MDTVKRLEKSVVAQIIYEKDDQGGEPKSRTVLPTYVPDDFVRTIDLTDLSEFQQEDIITAYREYQQYYDTFTSTMFNFETWLEHTYGQGNIAKPKWRAFKLNKIKVL